MLKKTITYKDYDDVERTEDFYFNLTQTEISKMELSIDGGLVKKIEKMIAEKDGGQIMDTFESVILSAYGEKSADGKFFQKSDEISKRFSWTPAYDQLFMLLCTDPDAAAVFINGIVPSKK
jgi:phosphatidylethanolamine-binding protein (PEBP) family uncharacterized protein